MAVKFTNNAATTLAAGINSSATSISVTDGSVFPSLSSGEHFYCTFDDTTNVEIVKVTARSGNTLTVVRGQDDTTARAFSSGDKAELRVVAALLEDVKTEVTSTLSVDTFTGDDATTAFTLSQAPASEDNLIVFIEGVYQNPGDFTLSGTTLTLDTAPLVGRKIVAYHVSGAVSGNNHNHDQFTADGSTAAFTLSIAPIHENNTQVFIDGVYQQKDSYAVSGTTLTLDANPANGAKVEVMTFTQTDVNTLPASFVSGLTEVTAVGADHMVIFDATDSALKKALISDIGITGISSSADATAITIDSSERVGIGKSPTKELDVAGTIKAVGATNNNTMEVFGAETSNQSFGLLVNAGTSSSDYSALFRDEDANTVLNIQGDGNIGVGTASPATQAGFGTPLLEVRGSSGGSVLSTNSTTGGEAVFVNSSTGLHLAMAGSANASTGNNIIFRTGNTNSNYNSSERARITSDGHFLIGTTSVAATTLDGTGGSNNAVVIGAETTQYPVLVLQSSDQRWLADYITNDGSLRTYNTTSNYETMITDTSGRVTFPKQPHVQGSVTTNNNTNSVAKDFTAGTYSRGTLSVNVVSNQARFTAPVNGLYLILFATIMGTDSSRRDAYILVNGTTIAQSLNDAASGYHYRQMAQVLALSANDYVTFGADNWYDNTSTGYTVWRTASMTLLG